MTQVTFDSFELDRLDLFITQMLLKLLLRRVFRGSPGFAQAIAAEYEDSIQQFDFGGLPPERAAAAREYMLETGIRLISDSTPKPP